MLFNSYAYIFLFLPVTLIVYFLLNKLRLTMGSKIWLVLASLVFYGWWNPIYIPLIVGSIIFNYSIGFLMTRERGKGRLPVARRLLISGVLGNLALLGYFKYTDFFISNINSVGHYGVPLMHITLPLGISFFTFTQIAYLVDTEKGKAREASAINYGLFVTFFPHLLAGPIIHNSEMMPQFERQRGKVADYRNLAGGVLLFFIGLFKKTVIADTFAVFANNGFADVGSLTVFEAWAATLAYSLQLYYDFSGYTDMALGASQMFNIRLPINFDRPYRSLNVQEFWRRWHMTLGRFMRDYVYIPLGGSRVVEARILINMMITFFIVGLWHGAGWTFIIWGLIHGAALVIHHVWSKLNIDMPKWLAWLITFNFVNAAFVFFRAASIPDALRMLKAMAGLNSAGGLAAMRVRLAGLPDFGAVLGDLFGRLGKAEVFLGMFLIFFPLSFLFRNSDDMEKTFEPGTVQLVVFSLAAVIAVLYLGTYSEFLYFRF
jgi:alginate O-acetyltransferase complex protein AlgI